MNMHDILIDFLTYLYENNINIRDEKIDWQKIVKTFEEKPILIGHKGIEKENGFVSGTIPLKNK
jgi:hypothetical protein